MVVREVVRELIEPGPTTGAPCRPSGRTRCHRARQHCAGVIVSLCQGVSDPGLREVSPGFEVLAPGFDFARSSNKGLFPGFYDGCHRGHRVTGLFPRWLPWLPL